MTITDDHNRHCEIYCFERKSDIYKVIQKWLALVEKQFDARFKLLHSDNGGEFISHDMNEHWSKRGIKPSLAMPHKPQQNGMAECLERTRRKDADRARLVDVVSKANTERVLGGSNRRYRTRSKSCDDTCTWTNDHPV